MEEAAAAMGEYLKSGEAVILPDVPVPDNRIVPMEEIPADAVIYEVTLETEIEKAAWLTGKFKKRVNRAVFRFFRSVT